NIEESKIYYFYKSGSGNVLFRDTFFEVFESSEIEENKTIEKKRINSNNLNFFLEELKQTLKLSFGDQSLLNLDMYLSTHPTHFETAVSQIKVQLAPENIYTPCTKENVYFMSSLFAVNKMLNDIDTPLNIFNSDDYDKERFDLEKQTSFRMIIASGAVLLFLLLSAYLLEGFLAGKLENIEEDYLELSAKAGNVEKMKKENSYLKANLILLSKLKGNRVEYSNLLYDVTKIINSGCCLIGFNLKENTQNFITIEFSGLGYSQQDVAEFMSNMEYSHRFKEISLVYSSSLRESRGQLSGRFGDEDYVNFKITAKYYADQK
ncbi:MAG: PilN domain-containing protein, partial [Ignavibacteriaceae bacterium]